MGFYRQFETLEPLTGSVPEYPFAQLPNIAFRARLLLRGRTSAQLQAAAWNVDWCIEQYFDTEESDYLRRATAHDRPNYATKDNTSEIQALRTCIDWYLPVDDPEFPDGKRHEYVAVLALWKVADTIGWLKERTRPTTGIPEIDKLSASLPAELTVENPAVRERAAAECALDAMDAVCWAEQLQAMDVAKSEIESLRAAPKGTLSGTEPQDEDRAKQMRSDAASRAALHRHRANHESRRKVCEWCEKHLHTYTSMEKAANAVTSGTPPLVDVAPRTALKWIADWNRSTRTTPKTGQQ
jgi:hypothetical protein